MLRCRRRLMPLFRAADDVMMPRVLPQLTLSFFRVSYLPLMSAIFMMLRRLLLLIAFACLPLRHAYIRCCALRHYRGYWLMLFSR